MVIKQIHAIMLIGMMVIHGAGANTGKKKWRPLGCYKENVNYRALTILGHAPATSSLEDIVDDCMRKAEKLGFGYIGIRDNNECWGSCDRGAYGDCARNCIKRENSKYGIGLDIGSSFVYFNMPVWTPCTYGVHEYQYRLKLQSDQRPNCPDYNKLVVNITSRECLQGKRHHFYGPWSACNQICGNGGTQTKNRTCNKHELEEEELVKCLQQPEERVRSCNCKNCPGPCSFDGVLLQLLKDLTGVSKNNHMIEAFSQVYEAMEKVSSYNVPSEEVLIKKIKSLLFSPDAYGKDKQARILLGVLLGKQKNPLCNYTNVVQKVKTEIGEEGLKRLINADGNVTLTFVIDTSRSMNRVIHKAREIAQTIANYEFISNVDYVLSTFKDLWSRKFTGKVQRFNNLAAFTNALEHLTLKKSRDQCRAPVYAGIINAITKGNPKLGSPMYVFTDAPPKDNRQFSIERALYHAKMNKMSVNFFLHTPFTCYKKAKSKYEAIAKATGGFSLSFKTVSAMENLEQVVKGSLDGTSLIATKIVKAGKSGKFTRAIAIYEKEKAFVIDDIAEGGTILVEVTGSQWNKIELMNPSKQIISHDLSNMGTFIWTISRPSVGRWTVKVQTEETVNIRVKSQELKLNIEFTLRYMKESSNIRHPLIGEKAKVKMSIPNESRLKENSFNIEGWKVLPETNEGTLIIESMDPLNSDVKMVIRGQTLSGFDFTREKLVQPKIAVIRSLMPAWSSTYSQKEKFTYEAIIHFASSMNKESFRIELQTKSKSNDFYKWATNFTKDVTANVDYKISQPLTAPSLAGELAVRIIVTKEKVEVDLMEETFEIE